ncbi:MAG: hypothetical protein HRT47_01845 [Candidatus Caenarcaniphilales bacterium]|nr:hypothetical protein [Candidatus Caenarcaniphilales bacterium]
MTTNRMSLDLTPGPHLPLSFTQDWQNDRIELQMLMVRQYKSNQRRITYKEEIGEFSEDVAGLGEVGDYRYGLRAFDNLIYRELNDKILYRFKIAYIERVIPLTRYSKSLINALALDLPVLGQVHKKKVIKYVGLVNPNYRQKTSPRLRHLRYLLYRYVKFVAPSPIIERYIDLGKDEVSATNIAMRKLLALVNVSVRCGDNFELVTNDPAEEADA